MAFIEMTCVCSASFQYDTDNETRLELMSEAFRVAHAECNYMSQHQTYLSAEKTKRYDITRKEPREKEL